MTARYVVQAIATGVTDGQRCATWQVVDTRPEIEQYESQLGVTMTETKAPAWRQVAFCLKRQHADKIAEALNLDPDEIATDAVRAHDEWRSAEGR